MLRSPHRAGGSSSARAIAPPESSWPDIDDDDGWEGAWNLLMQLISTADLL